jgi:general secretion pathway protein G
MALWLGLGMVLTVLVGIVGLGVGFIFGGMNTGKAAAMRADALVQASSIALGLDAFCADVGRYPTPDEGLAILRTTYGNGPYIDVGLLVDPWGNPFQYVCDEAGIPSVVSLGADGRIGGLSYNSDVSVQPQAAALRRTPGQASESDAPDQE